MIEIGPERDRQGIAIDSVDALTAAPCAGVQLHLDRERDVGIGQLGLEARIADGGLGPDSAMEGAHRVIAMPDVRIDLADFAGVGTEVEDQRGLEMVMLAQVVLTIDQAKRRDHGEDADDSLVAGRAPEGHGGLIARRKTGDVQITGGER